MTTARERWERLQTDLRDAGVDMRLDSHNYQEMRGGRAVTGGTSLSLFLRLPGGRTVNVSDRWWKNNTDTWLGWVVWLDRDDIVTYESRPVRTRAEVITQITENMAGVIR